MVAEHGETVLEAAIRAGLNVDYGCNGGNCGRCVARLIEGEIEKTRHYDYVQSVAEKAQKQFLMCSYAPVSGLVLEARMADQDESIPEQKLRVKVRKVDEVADGVCILRLRTPRSQRLRFMAGQYARLSGEHFGGTRRSIASCPCEDRRLEFHVPRTGSEFSDYVFGRCRVGDELDVAAPFGNFFFREELRRAPRSMVLLVAFETGFAPIKSLVEHVTGREEDVPLYLYWITTTGGGPYLDNLCRAWNDAFDRFIYTPVMAKAGGDQAMQACARLIADRFPDLSASDVYLCTPTADDVVARACLERGLDPARLFHEGVHGLPV